MLGAKIAHFAIEPGNNMLDTPANTNIKSTSGINEKLDVAIRLDSQPVTTTPIFDSVTSAFNCAAKNINTNIPPLFLNNQ